MKALILAAGLGSRLKKNTDKIPKALVKINEHPILHYQLTALENVGIKDVVIVLGYKGELISNYINRYHKNFNVNYVVNNKYDKSNSSYSFWSAKDYIKGESYLHLNCDVIFSVDLLNSILQSHYNNVIAIRTDLPLNDGMENVTLKNNKIIKMSLNNSPEAKGKAFGLAKFSSKGTSLLIEKLSNYISKKDLNQNFYGMIRLAVNEMDFYYIKTDKSNLLEVNTVNDLSVANNNWIAKD